ncbi:MAG: pilus assembly protein TadG-related protein [Terriglobales bacterium]
MRQFKSTSRRQHGARGLTLPMLALFIVVLFAVASLAVDLGILYTARTSAQHAADSAALAGAWIFANSSPLATPEQKTASAQDAAIMSAAQNKILGKTVNITAADVNVDVANQRVTVTVPTSNTASAISLYFARVAGWTSSNVAARATAEAGPSAGSSQCVKPIFLPNTILATGERPKDACDNGHVIFDSNDPDHPLSNWYTTSYETTYMTPVYSAPQLSIRPIRPASALAPSQYYSIDFGELLNSSSGASTYRCTLGNCLNECASGTVSPTVACGNSFPLETGNMVGPTGQGVDILTGPTPDTFGGFDENKQFYYFKDGIDSLRVYKSEQVALVPVWNNCAEIITPGYHGQRVSIVGFVSMFFSSWDSSQQSVRAYFLGATPCRAAGTPGGAASAAQPVPIRLIQNP